MRFRKLGLRLAPVCFVTLFASGPAAASEAIDLRVIAVPEASVEIRLWDELEENGSLQSFYAVYRAGELVGRPRSTGHRVELADASFDPLVDGALPVAEVLAARPTNRLFLIQLFATALPEFQDEIGALGATIHRFYTEHTLLVEMSPTTKAAVLALPYVRWVGAYHPAFRVEPALRDLLTSGGEELAEARYSIMATRRGSEAQSALGRVVEDVGGTVEITTGDGFRMEATLSREGLLELLHDDRVHYVDRWGGPGETDMNIVREVGGADFVELEGSYTGQGVRGEIFDTELRTSHQEWAVAPIVHNPDGITTGATAHGTSVTSNVFAQGVNSLARGVAPDGQPIFFRYNQSTQFGGSVTRYTIAEELIDPAGPYYALFQTSSVGSNRTLNYTTISAEMDDILFLHQVIHTQSQSNAGNQDSRPQAWAKNIVSVGGFRHVNTADRSDDHWSFSGSIGPAADGRIKPDLAFFNDSIFSATRTSDTSYGSFGGTSSATPQTAGYFGLLFQMWHDQIWTGHGGQATVFDSRPKMITAKALMVHNAHRYDWNAGGSNADIDRFKQGWGTADARNLFDSAGETFVIDETELLAPGDTYTKKIVLGPGVAEFKATMAFVDPMGSVGAGVDRINDLTLRVTSPSAVVFFGNNGLTLTNESTAGGVSNTIDTVENVFVSNPEAGSWTVEVLGDEIVQDTHPETAALDADFALVVSPFQSIFVDGFESGDFSAWSTSFP